MSPDTSSYNLNLVVDHDYLEDCDYPFNHVVIGAYLFRDYLDDHLIDANQIDDNHLGDFLVYYDCHSYTLVSDRGLCLGWVVGDVGRD